MLWRRLFAWHTTSARNGEGETINDHPTFLNESNRQGDKMELQISVLFPTFHHTNSWFYCKVNSLNSLSIFMCYMERAAQSHGRYHSGDHNLKKDKSRLRLSKHLLCLALFCLIQMLFSGILGDFLHLTHFKKINFYFTNIEKNGEQTSFIEC